MRIKSLLSVFVCLSLLNVFSAIPSASVAVVSVGKLVKSSSQSAVYYVAADGKRYVFPNERMYFSWYANFDSVKTITDTALAAYQIGGNITYRAGSRLIKLTNDPKVYAVEPGGVLRWIPTEVIAKRVYGESWASRVDDVPDGFFPAYTLGSALGENEWPEGWLAKDSVSGQLVVYTAGFFRPITEEGIVGNRLDFIDPVVLDLSGFTLGTAMSATLGFFADASQDGYGKRQNQDVVVSSDRNNAPIFQGETNQQIGGLFVSVKNTTVLKNLSFTVKASINNDADFDAGGLIYGDNVENQEQNLTNIRLINDAGISVLNSASIGLDKVQDGASRLQLNGSLTLQPGQTHLRLVADVNSRAPAKEKYYVSWDIASSVFTVNGALTDLKIPLSFDGSEVEVSNGGIEVSLATGGGQQIFIAGAGNRQISRIGGFVLKNPLSRDVIVKDLSVSGYVDEGEDSDDFALGFDNDRGSSGRFFSEAMPVITLVTKEGIGYGSASMTSSGKASFYGMNMIIPARSSTTIYVGGEVSLDAPFDLHPDRIAVDLRDVSADIVAQELSGKSLDVFGDSVNGASSPTDYLVIAKHGEVTLKGSGSGGARLIMGESRKNTYTLKLTAEDLEDMQVDTLAVRLKDSTATRSVSLVELRYNDAVTGGYLYSTAPTVSGAATFNPTNLIIPKDKEVEVNVLVTVGTEASGAKTRDEIGWIFEPETFKVHGVQSGIILDNKDWGRFIINNTTPGTNSPVRRSAPVLRADFDSIEDPAPKDNQAQLFAFTVSSIGGDANITKLTFKIEPSDVGYDLNSIEADNDLLEYWADLPLSGLDNDAIADILDDNEDIIGDGIDGNLRYMIYDESLRQIVSPQGLDTARGDYGIITYELRTPIIATSIPTRYVLALDTTGFAVGSRTIKITLLDGSDFAWNDGSLAAPNDSGESISQLPMPGKTVTVK